MFTSPGDFNQLTAWERCRRDLVLYFCKPSARLILPSGLVDHIHPPDKRIKVVCTSDTHNTRPHIPDGDVLLHAGDLTTHGTFAEVQAQLDWLGSLPHRYKILIPGNHDKILDPDYVSRRDLGDRNELNWHDLIYLLRSSTTLQFPELQRTLSVYGDPSTPVYGHWAFQHPKKQDVWSHTVPNVDILLTHGPPKGHLDYTYGCPHLLQEIRRARPRLVLFGHIHEARGQEILDHDDWDEWARDQVNRQNMPGIIHVILIVFALLFHRAWTAVTGYKVGHNKSILLNAASLEQFGPREDEEEAAGVVVYM